MECDRNISNADEMHIKTLERNASNIFYKSTIDKKLNKIHGEGGKLRCIKMGNGTTPGFYIEYELGKQVKYKTITPDMQIYA